MLTPDEKQKRVQKSQKERTAMRWEWKLNCSNTLLRFFRDRTPQSVRVTPMSRIKRKKRISTFFQY